MEFVKEAHDKEKVVDLSADYRIQDVKMYEKWYKHAQISRAFKEGSVRASGIYRRKSKSGCGGNPAVTLLRLYSIAPALSKYEISDIIADSKSGVSGSGINRRPKTYSLMLTKTFTPITQGALSCAGS